MTKEDKELLFKDLCARLPYGVKVQVYYEDIGGSGYFDETVWLIDNDEPFHINDRWIENIKPYLRPMSSMTEEDKKELGNFVAAGMFASQNKDHLFQLTRETLLGDFFNKRHIDYRGLIEKGLAIEVTESNNPYK